MTPACTNRVETIACRQINAKFRSSALGEWANLYAVKSDSRGSPHPGYFPLFSVCWHAAIHSLFSELRSCAMCAMRNPDVHLALERNWIKLLSCHKAAKGNLLGVPEGPELRAACFEFRDFMNYFIFKNVYNCSALNRHSDNVHSPQSSGRILWVPCQCGCLPQWTPVPPPCFWSTSRLKVHRRTLPCAKSRGGGAKVRQEPLMTQE